MFTDNTEKTSFEKQKKDLEQNFTVNVENKKDSSFNNNTINSNKLTQESVFVERKIVIQDKRREQIKTFSQAEVVSNLFEERDRSIISDNQELIHNRFINGLDKKSKFRIQDNQRERIKIFSQAEEVNNLFEERDRSIISDNQELIHNRFINGLDQEREVKSNIKFENEQEEQCETLVSLNLTTDFGDKSIRKERVEDDKKSTIDDIFVGSLKREESFRTFSNEDEILEQFKEKNFSEKKVFKDKKSVFLNRTDMFWGLTKAEENEAAISNVDDKTITILSYKERKYEDKASYLKSELKNLKKSEKKIIINRRDRYKENEIYFLNQNINLRIGETCLQVLLKIILDSSEKMLLAMIFFVLIVWEKRMLQIL